jgi:hypothetical protein
LTDAYRIEGWGNAANDSVWFSNGDGTFSGGATGPYTSVNNNVETSDIARIKVGDFNGDGMLDVYRVNGWGSSDPDSIYFSNGDGTFTHSQTGPATWVTGSTGMAKLNISRIRMADFNGDGLTDVYRIEGWGNSEADSIYFSEGGGNFFHTQDGPETSINSSSHAWAQFSIDRIHVPGDFNGDGLYRCLSYRRLG